MGFGERLYAMRLISSDSLEHPWLEFPGPLADLRHRHAIRALLQNKRLLSVRKC
jgi:hypothetical protein